VAGQQGELMVCSAARRTAAPQAPHRTSPRPAPARRACTGLQELL
jgi:hypothetical protein